MESMGWEIRPVGWILLIVLLGILTYYVVNWLQHPPNENQ